MKTVPVLSFPHSNKTHDVVASEAPLIVDIIHGKAHHRKISLLTTTMRTPGHDRELILGLLFSLGIINQAEQIRSIDPCLRSKLEDDAADRISIQLAYDCEFFPHDFSYGHPRYSGCGVCGSHVLPMLMNKSSLIETSIKATVLLTLPQKMAREQKIFSETGGVHAAALFDSEGELLAIFEDVGRHNALDKLIGHFLLMPSSEWQRGVVALSSRASFEMVQKVARAGLGILAAMGAVSSLAVKLAQENGVTLVGFLREDRFNVYTCSPRITGL